MTEKPYKLHHFRGRWRDGGWDEGSTFDWSDLLAAVKRAIHDGISPRDMHVTMARWGVPKSP